MGGGRHAHPAGGAGRGEGGEAGVGGGGLGGALCTSAEGGGLWPPPLGSQLRAEGRAPPLCTLVLGGGHGGCCASAANPRPITNRGAMGVLQVPRPVRSGHRAEGRFPARAPWAQGGG